MWNIEVYYQSDIIDIDASCDDIGRHQNINLSVLEVFHYFFALRLLEVGMHLCHIELHPPQGIRQFFHLDLGRSEDDHALRASLAEEIFQNLDLLCVIADISRLHDGLWRTGNS